MARYTDELLAGLVSHGHDDPGDIALALAVWVAAEVVRLTDSEDRHLDRRLDGVLAIDR